MQVNIEQKQTFAFLGFGEDAVLARTACVGLCCLSVPHEATDIAKKIVGDPGVEEPWVTVDHQQ